MSMIDGFIIWIHLLSASIWVGGSIFIGIILAPMLKHIGNSMEERVIIHIKSFGKGTEAKIIENRGSEYINIIRSKIINYGRLTVILSIIILLLAAFLDAGIKFS